MAVLGRLLIASAERLDLPDLLSIDSFAAGDFKFLLKALMNDDRPYILRGFDVINPQDAIGSQNVAIRLSESVVFYPGSTVGSFYHGLEEGNPNAQPIVPELRKNATNYVYCTLDTFETSKDTRAFWDPDLDGGVGGEFTQDIDTESVLNVDVNVSVSSFPENTIPIAIIKVGATVIESIEDARDLMFRLGSGGISPDPFSKYSFRNDPSSTYARKEPPTEMSSALDPNAFQGADKNIKSLKEWMDAVMTKLAELGGTTFWYEDASTFSLINLFLDAVGTSLSSKGRWEHNSATPGLLAWSEDIKVKSIPDPREIIIRQGNKTLSDNDIMYIDLTREEQINSGNIEVEWFNGLDFVNGTLGTFQNLNKGDWVKKSDDRNDLYLRVEELYANENKLGGVTSPALAKSIKLSAAYPGINQTQRGVYTKGQYTAAEVSLSTRGSSALADLGGNLMWLATRQDTVQNISDITATTLALINITEADGITAKITSVAHGLNDNDWVTITDSVVGYNGTYQVQVESTDIFYINTTQTGDENGVANAYYAIVTTAVVSTTDGYQLESANHGFNTNDTISVADTSSSFDSTYQVGTTTNTTFQVAVGSAIPTVSVGTATLAKVNVRSEFGNVTIVQGETTGIGNEDNQNIRQFIGMASSSETHPTYNIPPSYNTLDGSQNYNGEVDDNLTVRVSKLTSMMADKAQDKTIKFLPSGYQSVSNTLNGTAREITFDPVPAGTPRLDIAMPSSANSGFIGLSNSFLLEQNQAAYIQVDRNAALSVANLSLIAIANLEDIPLEENTLILAIRLATDEVWMWDGFPVSPGVAPIPSFLDQIVQQDRNAKMVRGGTWNWDLPTDTLTLSSDAFVQISNIAENRNTIQASNIVLANDGDVASVEIVRSSGIATNLVVTVGPVSSLLTTTNTLVIARRIGNDVLVGNGTFLLKDQEYLELDGALAEVNRFFSQLQITPENPNSTKAKISSSDIVKLDSKTLGQELSGLLMKFNGALIDFSTGVITESNGITALGVNFTPSTITASQYKWYSVSLIADNVTSDNRISAQVLVIPADGEGATADAAPRAAFGGTKRLGQVVVKDNGAGGAGTIDDISMSNITQLGVGAGSGGGQGFIISDYIEEVLVARPATTATLVDGSVVQNGDIVLFTNLSVPSENNRLYKASIVGINITWQLQRLGQDPSGTPADGDGVYVTKGTSKADRVFFFDGTIWFEFVGALFNLLGFNPHIATTVPYGTLPDGSLFSNLFTTSDSLVTAISTNTANINDIGTTLATNAYSELLTIVAGAPADDNELTGPIAGATVISLPLDSRDSNAIRNYIVGDGLLKVFLNGQLINSGVDYTEVGVAGSISTQIQTVNILEIEDVITFKIDSLGGFLVSGAGVGDITDGANVGGEREVFKVKSGSNLTFRTLKEGNGVTLTQNTNDIEISSASAILVVNSTSISRVLVLTEDVVLVDANGGDVTLTLPPAATAVGKKFYIKKIDASGNFATADGNGAETIDDLLTQSTDQQYETLIMVSNGTAWYML